MEGRAEPPLRGRSKGLLPKEPPSPWGEGWGEEIGSTRAASLLLAERAGQAGLSGSLCGVVARLRLVADPAALAPRPLHLRLLHHHEGHPGRDADRALRRLPVRRSPALDGPARGGAALVD